MSEEDTPPAGGQAETVPPSLVSADGSLVSGWQQHAPEGYEDLRDDKTLSTMKNVWSLGKSYVHVRKQVPLDKMPRPNENWGNEEWEEFYKAGGRPETPKDYGEFEMPPNWPEDILPWEKTKTGWQNLFHKYGASKKLVDAIVAYNTELAILADETETKLIKENADRIEDALRGEWGRAYEQKSYRAERIIDKGTKEDEGLHNYILTKMKEDVLLKKWMANMADQFFEHEAVETPTVPTPSDIDTQIKEIMEDPKYNSPNLSVRQPLINKVQRLMAQKQPA